MYYETKTKGVIFDVTAPVIYGAYTARCTQYTTNLNVCETQNRGIELALNTRNIVTKDFEWSSSVAFSYNKEKDPEINRWCCQQYSERCILAYAW